LIDAVETPGAGAAQQDERAVEKNLEVLGDKERFLPPRLSGGYGLG